MTLHWIHVAISWGGTALVFCAMAVLSVLRQRRAVATLKRLDPRGDRER